MATTVAEAMTVDPATVNAEDPVSEAARQMRTSKAGNVLVLDGGRLVGIVTDRDIATCVITDPATPVREACSGRILTTVTPDADLEQAVEFMHSMAIRRLPVIDGNRPVGIVSIGDLAR